MKSKLPFILLFYLLLGSCLETKSSKVKIHKIIYKWNAQLSSAQVCDDCKENSKDCCVIKFDGKRFAKSLSYQLNENGRITKVYSYHVPLGVNILTLQQYSDIFQTDIKQLTDEKIYWDSLQQVVVDNGKIIDNYKNVESEKKMYVLKNNNLIVYEYE